MVESGVILHQLVKLTCCLAVPPIRVFVDVFTRGPVGGLDLD